jgi:hypothetical protein
MSGDWFAGSCGWGPILKPDRIKKALRSIFKHNFREGEGLINASYPPGTKRRIAASGNYQADAPWTGIEYTVAALLIDNGMVAEGLAIVNDIHTRYLTAGRVWNHVECGGHYYRAMSSWTVLIALSGYAWDQPTGTLTLAPAIDEPACEYPFFASGAWGTYYQESSVAGRTAEVEVADGEMMVSRLNLPKLRGFASAAVCVGGEEVASKTTRLGKGICVTFDSPVTLTPETPLLITG